MSADVSLDPFQNRTFPIQKNSPELLRRHAVARPYGPWIRADQVVLLSLEDLRGSRRLVYIANLLFQSIIQLICFYIYNVLLSTLLVEYKHRSKAYQPATLEASLTRKSVCMSCDTSSSKFALPQHEFWFDW